ncbi:hypothetical protein D9M68_694220 [compost metagenome]
MALLLGQLGGELAVARLLLLQELRDGFGIGLGGKGALQVEPLVHTAELLQGQVTGGLCRGVARVVARLAVVLEQQEHGADQ